MDCWSKSYNFKSSSFLFPNGCISEKVLHSAQYLHLCPMTKVPSSFTAQPHFKHIILFFWILSAVFAILFFTIMCKNRRSLYLFLPVFNFTFNANPSLIDAAVMSLFPMLFTYVMRAFPIHASPFLRSKLEN